MLRVRFLLFYSEIAPTDPWCNMLRTLIWRKKYEEAMSDEYPHCVKSFQIRSYLWVVFSCIRTDTERSYLSLFSPNTRKYGPEINLYLDTFQCLLKEFSIFANLLIKKPVNSLAIVKMWKKHLEKKHFKKRICIFS